MRIAAIFGFLSVGLGAMGAHALSRLLAQNGTAAIWEKAVLYHLAHSVLLAAIARGSGDEVRPCPFIAFSLGIAIFSGSLYVLAVTNIRWLGAITPVGGVALMVGWVCLALPQRR